MRFKLTILLLALNAALIGLIYYSDKVQSTRNLVDEAARLVLRPDFVRGLERITISGQDADTPWIIQHHGPHWQVESPLQWSANPFAVEQLLFQLLRLSWESRFPVDELDAAGQGLAAYGLQDPPLRLELSNGGDSITLAMGNPTEIGNRLYILSPDGDYVLVVRRGLLDILQRDTASLLDRRLFDLSYEETRALQIQDRSAGNVRVRLTRDQGDWRFISPIETAADPDAVQALLLDWQGTEVAGFEPAGSLPSGSENAQLRFTIEGLTERETVILSPPDGNSDSGYFLARKEGLSAVFRIEAEKVDALRSAQENLRERRMLARYSAGWTTLQLHFGELAVTLQQLENGSWQVLYADETGQLRSLPADPDAIERMQTFLNTMEAERFVTDAPSEADLARFGLDEPQRRLRLRIGSQWAIEFRVGGIFPENGQTLLYARTNRSDSVFLVRPYVLSLLALDPYEYRERSIRKLPESAQVDQVSLVHRISGIPIPLETASGESGELREHLRAFFRDIRVERFLNRPFADPLPLDRDRQLDWPYQLDAQVSYPANPDRPPARIRLYLSRRLGGTAQYIGDPESGLVGTLPAQLIELLDAVLAEYPVSPDSPPAVIEDPQLEPEPEPGS
jgi:hypothetical protein